MTVGLFHVGGTDAHRQSAARAIASVRQAMPDVPIAHLTDATSASLDGVDRVIRAPVVPDRIALACLDLYAAAGAGDWLFLDTDTVVQADVLHVFLRSFDVAVASRVGTLLPHELGTKFMDRMPHNKGVVFSRAPQFWIDAGAHLRTCHVKQQQWMGDQRAMCDVIATGRYAVEVLPNAYNYPPQRPDEDVSRKAILHYKGPSRKAWRQARAA